MKLNQVNNPRALSLAALAVVVGPNYDRATKAQFRWSARLKTQRGSENLPQDALIVKNLGTVAADYDESNGGCSYRASGEFATAEEVLFSGKTLAPVHFQPSWGHWCSEAGQVVELEYLVCLPTGKTLGIAK